MKEIFNKTGLNGNSEFILYKAFGEGYFISIKDLRNNTKESFKIKDKNELKDICFDIINLIK